METDQDFGEDRRNHGSKGLIKASRSGPTGILDPNVRRPSDNAFREALLVSGWKESDVWKECASLMKDIM